MTLSDFVKKSGVPAALSRLCPVKESAKGVADNLIYRQIFFNFIDNASTPYGVWEYVDIVDQRGSWDIARRAIYTRRTRTKNGQYELHAMPMS